MISSASEGRRQPESACVVVVVGGGGDDENGTGIVVTAEEEAERQHEAIFGRSSSRRPPPPPAAAIAGAPSSSSLSSLARRANNVQIVAHEDSDSSSSSTSTPPDAMEGRAAESSRSLGADDGGGDDGDRRHPRAVAAEIMGHVRPPPPRHHRQDGHHRHVPDNRGNDAPPPPSNDGPAALAIMRRRRRVDARDGGDGDGDDDGDDRDDDDDDDDRGDDDDDDDDDDYRGGAPSHPPPPEESDVLPPPYPRRHRHDEEEGGDCNVRTIGTGGDSAKGAMTMLSHQQRHHPQDFRTRSAPSPDYFGPARLRHHLPHATAGRPRSTSEATSGPRSRPEALERIVARDRARREAEYAIEYELSRNYHRRWGGGGGGGAGDYDYDDDNGYDYGCADNGYSGYYGATPSFRGMMMTGGGSQQRHHVDLIDPIPDARRLLYDPLMDERRHGRPPSSVDSLDDALHRRSQVRSTTTPVMPAGGQGRLYEPGGAKAAASTRPRGPPSPPHSSPVPRVYRERDFGTNRLWQEDDHAYRPERRDYSGGGSIVIPPPPYHDGSEGRGGIDEEVHLADDPPPPTATARRSSRRTTDGTGNSGGGGGGGVGGGAGGDRYELGEAGGSDAFHPPPRHPLPYYDGGGGGGGGIDEEVHRATDRLPLPPHAQRRQSSREEEDRVLDQEQPRSSRPRGSPVRGPNPPRESPQVRGGVVSGRLDVAYIDSFGGAIVLPPPPYYQALPSSAPMPGGWDHRDTRGAFVGESPIPAVSYYPYGPPHAPSPHLPSQEYFHPHVPGSIMQLSPQPSQAAHRNDDRRRDRWGMWVDPHFGRDGQGQRLNGANVADDVGRSRAGIGMMKSPSSDVEKAAPNHNAWSPPPSSSIAPPHQPRKMRVFFSHLQIRTYETIMSDNPSCSGGPSIGIGWRYDPVHYVATIDEYAAHQARLYGRTHDGQPIEPRPEDLVLHRCEREFILLKTGYTRQDMVDSVRALNKAKNKRRQTVHNLPVAFVEEGMEVMKRTLRRWILNKKHTRHMYEEWIDEGRTRRPDSSSL